MSLEASLTPVAKIEQLFILSVQLDYTDLLSDIKISRIEVASMNKDDSLQHLHIRLESAILVNNETTLKQKPTAQLLQNWKLSATLLS